MRNLFRESSVVNRQYKPRISIHDSRFTILLYKSKQAIPPWAVLPTKPDNRCLTNNMVFGNKSPKALVLGFVSIITHHPVIVHLECIGWSFLAIDKNFTTLLLPGIFFID